MYALNLSTHFFPELVSFITNRRRLSIEDVNNFISRSTAGKLSVVSNRPGKQVLTLTHLSDLWVTWITLCLQGDGLKSVPGDFVRHSGESRNPVKQRVVENRAFYPQNDPFKLIYSPVLVFIHNIINGLSRVIQVRP